MLTCRVGETVSLAGHTGVVAGQDAEGCVLLDLPSGRRVRVRCDPAPEVTGLPGTKRRRGPAADKALAGPPADKSD